MSKTIDERVVEMRFDNDNFERNVKTSMNTLDKFKTSLNFDGASKGLTEINDATKKVNFGPLSDALETVKIKFSALEVFATSALWRISNSAMAAGERIVKALTTDPIKTGFNEYEQKMDAVRVIMASAGEAEGKTLDEVTAKIQELNKYADDTIYSFADMTLNIGKFTNAGVKLDDAVLAIKGISNEAARSGANANEASRAMYNFAQALSMGYVQLIDWKSIENANMATVEFKNTLLETAIATGKVTKTANGMYKTGKDTYNLQQMFKDGLKDQWLTSDILIDTLKKYADESTEFGQKMFDAAKQVTTVSKLWDTLREAAQSGWGQTWELMIGNLDEARVLLTNVSNVISDIINKTAEMRNNVLKEWRELGGRSDLIEAFSNLYKSISSLIKPITEAFREIFPRVTGKQLADVSKKFKEFAASLIISEQTSENIKNTFKGFFKTLNLGLTVIRNVASALIKFASNFKNLGSYVLAFTGSLGNALGNFADFITSTGILTNGLTMVVDLLQKIIDKVKEFGKEIFSVKKVTDIFSGIFTFLGSLAKSITNTISSVIKTGGLKDGIDIINGGIFGGILLGIKKFISNINQVVDNSKGLMGNVQELLKGVKDTLKAYQMEINAKTLMEIAKALALMTISLYALASIDTEKLLKALAGMLALIWELMYALKKFISIASADTFKNVTRSSIALVAIGNALLLLAVAMKILSTIGIAELASSLVALALGLNIMVAALEHITPYKIIRSAAAINVLANGLILFAVAMKILSTVDWKTIIPSLIAIAGGLAAMVTALNLLQPEKAIGKAFSMILLADALILLATSLKILSTIGWKEMGVSLGAMAAAMFILVTAMNAMNPYKAVQSAFSMILLSTSLIILAKALKKLAEMNWGDIKRSLTTLFGAMTILVLAMKLMSGSMVSAVSFLVIASSLIVLAEAIKIFGSMNPKTISNGLIAIAKSFILLGVAGTVLGALSPFLLLAAAAMGLFGLAAIALGKGLVIISAGILAFSGAISGSVDIIIASLSGIILGLANMVPELIDAFGNMIKAFLNVIIETIPLIVHTIVKVGYEILKELETYAPQILDTLISLFIKVIDALAKRMPELMNSMLNLAGAFIQSFMDAIGRLNPDTIAKGIECIKGLVIILGAMAALKLLAPAAAIGIIEFGALVSELAIILALVGQLTKIPGLEDSVNKAGDLLLLLGEVIGKFVAGLVKGTTSTLPEIGKTLTEFMGNVSGFVTGVKNVDDSVLSGTTILSKSILELTKSNFISSIADFITKGKMFGELGSNLSEFMKNAEEFIKGVNALKPDSLKNFEEFTKSIIAISVSGFFNKITIWTKGKSTLETLGEQLPKFGESLKSFSDSIDGLKVDNVQKAIDITYKLVDITTLLSEFKGKDLENKGWGFGSAIGHLAEGISYFSTKINECGLDEGKITAACKSIKTLSKTVTDLSDFKGNKLENTGWGFGSAIGHLAEGISYFSTKINECKFDESKVTSACKAIKELANTCSDLSNFKGKNLENQGWGFGSSIGHLAEGISYFSAKINESGFDEGKVISACNAIKELANTCSDLSDFKGKNLENQGWGFGSAIGHLAEGISYFSAKINESKLDESKVTAACNAIKELANTCSDLSDFKGKDLENEGWGFGSAIGHLANGISYFSAKINESKLDEGKVTSACNAIKEISNIMSDLPDIDGSDLENKGWGVGSAIGHLANGISYFAAKINECKLDEGKVTAASNAIKSITEVFNNLPDISGGNLENRGWGVGSTIGHLANGISYFSAKINECKLDEGKITSAVNSIKTLSEIIPSLSDIKGGDLENKGWGFGSLIGHLANGISYFSAKINDCGLDEGKITSACNSIKTLSEVIPNISNVKGGDLENKGWGFGSLIGHLANGISYFSAKINECKLNENLITAACNSIKTLSETIPNISDIKGGDLENKGWGFGSAIGHLANGISYFSAKVNECNLNENLITAACNSIKSLSETISALPDIDGVTLENKGWGFGSAIGHLAEGIGYFSAKINGNNLDEGKMNVACNSIKSLSEVMSSLPDMDGSTLENKGWGFGSAIGHLGNAISAFINGIGNVDITNMEAYIGYIQKFADIALNISDDAGTKLTNFAGGISVFATNFVSFFNSLTEIGLETIEEGIGKVNELIAMASSIAEINVEQISTFSNSLVQVANDGVTGFCTAFEGSVPRERAKQAVVKMLISALTGAMAMKPRIITEFNAIAEGSIAALRSYYQSFFDAGKYLSQGFADGITANSGAAIAAAAEMGRKAAEALRNATDEHSPSKITEEIGNYFGEGLVIGIRDYFGKVYNTAFNVGDMAKEGLSNAIAKISQMVEDGIDTSPTIRPVLDLSEVEQGASYLNSMLGTNSVGLRENINSIANGFNSRIQNGSGLDLLNAINKLETTVRGSNGNTLNIYTQELDSEKLDQIVRHVNKELGVIF